MSLRTSATRYAKALLDVAILEADPARVEPELAAFVDAMQRNADLRRVMTSPGIAHAARVKIVSSLAAQAGAQAPVRKLLELLADRGRFELLPEILAVYRERLLAHRNIVRADVVSAAPLEPEKVRALADRLAAVTGRQVELDASVDPSMIGGVVTRIGSTVYDGSIRTQLEKMRESLVEQA